MVGISVWEREEVVVEEVVVVEEEEEEEEEEDEEGRALETELGLTARGVVPEEETVTPRAL